MERDFQTSFIPKKPVTPERVVTSRPTSLLTVISIFILFTVLLASGGLYFYKSLLDKNVLSMQANLELAKNRFEPSKIVQLQVLDSRLKSATEILSNHVAVSPIFKILQDVTMKTVGYTKFSYTLGADKGNMVHVQMSGVAIGYRSVALQADLFAQNKFLIDPVFSNLSLDNNGNVVFDLNFSVEPSLVNYKKNLLTESTGASAPTTVIQPATTATN